MFEKKQALMLISLFFAACGGDNKQISHNAAFEENCDEAKGIGCVSGLICYNNFCRMPCSTKSDCPVDYLCTDNRCVKDPNYQPVNDEKETCGNGQEDTGESCDDGNNLDGDGCSAKCNIEPNYTCTGWPSTCQCATGYQDHNNDGICQKDCDSCQENEICTYNSAGLAQGCICASGYQDSNSDGHCQSDCQQCDKSQICLYNDDGLALGCSCPEGSQDNDNDGVCEEDCETYLSTHNQGNYQYCDDSQGHPQFLCAVYVSQSGTGVGTSWSDPTSFSKAIISAESLMAAQNQTNCTLLLDMGDYSFDSSVTLKNINIIGSIDRSKKSLTKLDQLNTFFFISDELAGSTSGNLFNIDGSVSISGVEIINQKTNNIVAIKATNAANLTIDRCNFRGNFTGISLSQKSSGTVNNSTFIKQTYGAIEVMDGSSLTVNSTNFIENVRSPYKENGGGAIYADSSSIKVDNCYFVKNRTGCYQSGRGGAILATNSIVDIKDSIFAGNLAQGAMCGHNAGGAIFEENGTITIDNSIFAGNGTKTAGSSSCLDSSSGNDIVGLNIYSTGISNVRNVIVADSINELVSHSANVGGGFYITSQESSIVNAMVVDTYFRARSNRNEGFKYGSAYLCSGPVGYSSFYFSMANNNALNGGTFYNSLLLDKPENNSYLAKYTPVKYEGSWSTALHTDESVVTTLVASSNLWEGADLRGKFVKATLTSEMGFADGGESLSSFMVPIISNSASSITIPGDPSSFDIANGSTLNELFVGKDIVILDPTKVTINDSNEDIVDQGDSSMGPQWPVDITGKTRGDKPDLGPYEIN